jgi:hypothetical protein
MNYCTIEDAWRNSDYITDQFRIYENPYEKKINTTENFENTDFSIDYTDNQQISGYDQNITNAQVIQNNDNKHQISNPNLHMQQQIKTNHRYKHCSFTCDDFWEHIQICSECRNKIRKRFSSKIIENIKNIIADNKDILLIILICLFILVFFNLLIKLFR